MTKHFRHEQILNSADESGGADPHEFTAKYCEIHSRLQGYVVSLVADPVLTDDLMQDVAMICWRAFPRYDAATPFFYWVCGIARNVVRRHFRSVQKDALRLKLTDETMAKLSTAYRASEDILDIRKAALRLCLAKLSHREREMVNSYYQSQVERRVVGTTFGMAEESIRKSMFRIRQRLMRCIHSRLSQDEVEKP